jgi:hypothetical protein
MHLYWHLMQSKFETNKNWMLLFNYEIIFV